MTMNVYLDGVDDDDDDVLEETEEETEDEEETEEDEREEDEEETDTEEEKEDYNREDTPELEEDTEIIFNPEDYDRDPTDTADVDDNDYNELYDIYRIHQTNQRNYALFGSNIAGMNFGLGYGQASHSNTNDEILSCPVCGEWLHYPEVNEHVMNEHTSLYVTMNMLLNRNITIDNVQQMINSIYSNEHQISPGTNPWVRTYDTLQNLMFLENTEYEPSYEELLNLCDQIGYHKPGIKNVDAVTVIIEDEDKCKLLKEEETCRICLEFFTAEDEIRKINSCHHMFCSGCIKTWFLENKTCPLCNLNVAEQEPVPEPEPRRRNRLEDVD